MSLPRFPCAIAAFRPIQMFHEVTWLPAPEPPRLYFDPARRLCVTIRGEEVRKLLDLLEWMPIPCGMDRWR